MIQQSPYEAVRAKYEDYASEESLTWEELVGFHLADPLCYVIKGPDFFVMGRAVTKSAEPWRIRDLTHAFPPEECDAWFLYAFAGNISKALRELPYELPWLAWERAGDPEKELKFLSTQSIRRLSPQ